jgi:hypothetical protein
MVQADKKLFTEFQRNNQSLDDYVKSFSARREMAEAVGSSPGKNKAATVVLGAREKLSWDMIKVDSAKKKELTEKAAEEYYAALMFDGLNMKRYSGLKTKVRNDFVVSKLDSVPKSVSGVLELAQRFVTENPPIHNKSGTAGVAFMQPGEQKEKEKEKEKEKKSYSEALGDEEKEPIGKSTKDGCFHCNGDHWASNCPKLTKEQKDKLYEGRAAANEAAYQAKKRREGATATDNTAVEGQIHIGINEADVDGITAHEDDYNEDFAFIQSTRRNVAPTRSNLGRDKLYLDTTSSFHQMFHADHLEDVRKVSTTLKAHCNAGTTHSDEKGMLLGLFDMWIVRDGIANILSVPQLVRDGFVPEFVLYLSL